MESISRISSLLESARELTLDAAQAARSSTRTATKSLPTAALKKLLDSRNEREIQDGLRRVTAMMYRGQRTLPFFSSVVKNVASPNLEIKKLVYIYLIHHAEQEPDLALLSINTIQKSLSDGNPQVRALALRTMSGIRVPVISQIVSLAIKKGAGDMSPLVRRAAALSLPKCYRLEPACLPQLIEYLSGLLGDKQYFVAGAAISAFLEICPERLDLIHPHYRSLVKKVVDMDEWSQLAMLRLMNVYARKCFPRRTRSVNKAKETSGGGNLQDFYGGGETAAPDGSEATEVLDPDLVLLLNTIKPLLQSRNSGVVLAVARCYANIGTPEYTRMAVGPLVALMRSAQDIEQVALYNIVSVCLVHPASFVKYASHFLVRATDSAPVWELKLEILTLIFPHSPLHTKSLILNELEHFSRGTNKALVREAVRAIGRCAQTDPTTAPRCMRLLLGQITSLDGTLAAESLTVIRHLIQQDPEAHTGTVVRLAKNLDSATDPQARATIIWLVGEFAGLNGEDNIAADVLRILLREFTDESEIVKRQIVLLAAKVYLHHINREAEKLQQEQQQKEQEKPASEENGEDEDAPRQSPAPAVQLPSEDHPIAKLWSYVLLLVRYDTSYDLRDRTRLYKALLEVPQLATLMLLAPKPAPQALSPSETRKGLLLGSSALVLAGGGGVHGLRGYEPLPAWVPEGREPDPRLRGTQESSSRTEYGDGMSRGSLPASQQLDAASSSRGMEAPGAGKSNGSGAKTLDDWLAEDKSESEEEEEESGEEEEEESGEEYETDEGGEEEGEEEDDDSEGEKGELQRFLDD
ncbi:ap-3 adaptor complex subunit beta [Apiospora saccharicola]|uniref:Ap-3 adaptor complex subunit beta n=1 Tax=Apiospora saccharicola TaxID=335842 RepID=A0ABR1UQ22_9PEZI